MKKEEYYALIKSLEKRKTNDENSPFHILSRRELEIVVAISIGWSPATTADSIGIAVKSYGTYRARVFDKLQIKSNAELAILAFELGFAPSVLQWWKEKQSEHDSGNGRGSIKTTGGGSGLLPGNETTPRGPDDGTEEVGGSDQRGAGTAE